VDEKRLQVSGKIPVACSLMPDLPSVPFFPQILSRAACNELGP
jgi:hypothetical protein